MRPKRDGWNILLAGFWNRLIFTPDWVIPHFFPGEQEIETHVALLPILPIIYKTHGVSLEVSSTRLVLRPPVPFTDEGLLRIEKMARIALDSLPETPVQAVGINFAYEDNHPAPHLLAMFNDVDDVELGQLGWEIGERRLARRLSRRDDVLNLSAVLKENAVTFEFNFYIEVGAPASQAINRFAARKILDLRDAATELLSHTYNVEVEDGDVAGL